MADTTRTRPCTRTLLIVDTKRAEPKIAPRPRADWRNPKPLGPICKISRAKIVSMALSRPNRAEVASMTITPRIVFCVETYLNPSLISLSMSSLPPVPGDDAWMRNRAMTTARKLTPLVKNAPAVPTTAMRIPANAGPRTTVPFHRRELRAMALGRSRRGTREGRRAWRAGDSTVPNIPPKIVTV